MSQVIFVGDIHGDWELLFHRIKHYKLSDCILINVGDVGVGFISNEKQNRQFSHLNDRFKKEKIQFKAIRGNHDDPSYFDGSVNLSHFELIPDYTVRVINDEKYLFIGGGVSIDRFKRTLGHSYWSNEEIILSPERVEKCDVLVTHSTPSWNGPSDKKGIESWCKFDPMLWDDCLRERKVMDELIKLSTPRYQYGGHFHVYQTTTVDGTTSVIIDICQFHEHREVEKLTEKENI